MPPRKQIYKITYPNGKIYVGMDLIGMLLNVGSPSARERIAADLDAHRLDLTLASTDQTTAELTSSIWGRGGCGICRRVKPGLQCSVIRSCACRCQRTCRGHGTLSQIKLAAPAIKQYTPNGVRVRVWKYRVRNRTAK